MPAITFLCLFIAALTACAPMRTSNLVTSQTPLPTGFALSAQQTMQAMQHWDHHAHKVATGCAQAMDHFFPGTPPRIYVAPIGATPFGVAFREAVMTRLVDFGTPVAFEPQGAAVLEVTLGYVTHQRTLTSGLWGSRKVVEPDFQQGKDKDGHYLSVPVVAEETGTYSAPVPDAEIQINTALAYDGTYLFRDSSIYYVNAAEWAHYLASPPLGGTNLKRFSLVNQ